MLDVRHVLDGSASGGGPAAGDTVVVIDEIGFHHATSVAELLADRGCQVEVVTNGMVVGQDLGITLDMRGLRRGRRQGHRVPTDLVPYMGLDGRSLHLLHHPTGHMQDRTPDWVVLAVPAAPVEWLFHELQQRGLVVERIGDCGPAASTRRGHRRRAGGGGAVIALVPVRDGEAADGGLERRSAGGSRRRGG